MQTLSNLIRLSFYDRIQEKVPATFHELLPPSPEVQPIPGPPEEAAPQSADERDASTKRAFEMLTMVSIV